MFRAAGQVQVKEIVGIIAGAVRHDIRHVKYHVFLYGEGSEHDQHARQKTPRKSRDSKGVTSPRRKTPP